ncbi:MAG TPA: hypothetical protein VMW33_06005 [Ilumatobacteraceae bacterium]|nr:hypothetical protein [Ilumatobacteraceae bacterium]
MIAALFAELASSMALVAAEDDGAPVFLLLAGPAGAGGTYFLAWRYYRNTHTSHGYERETRIEAKPVTGNEAKVKEITGTKKSGIDGDNRSDHRRRVQRLD